MHSQSRLVYLLCLWLGSSFGSNFQQFPFGERMRSSYHKLLTLNGYQIALISNVLASTPKVLRFWCKRGTLLVSIFHIDLKSRAWRGVRQATLDLHLWLTAFTSLSTMQSYSMWLLAWTGLNVNHVYRLHEIESWPIQQKTKQKASRKAIRAFNPPQSVTKAK